MVDSQFVQRPYGERRIVVVSDKANDQSAKSFFDALKTVTDEQKGSHRTKSIAARIADEVNPLSAYVTWYKAGRLWWRSGSADGMAIIDRETARELSFPPGHPIDKVVYVGHPFEPHVYIPAASFHRFLFQHKVAEGIRLVVALAATSLKIEY